MDSTQIIKRRLAQLKKMSIELKQSTENSTELDFNLVYGILKATKSSASKMTQVSLSSAKQNNRSDSPLSKLLAINSVVSQPYRSLFPESNIRQSENRQRINSKSKYIKINGSPHIQRKRQGYQEHYFVSPHQDFQEQADQFIGSLGLQTNENPDYPQQIYNLPQNQQQVISLREQNSQLEKNILNLRHELQQLREKQQTVEQQQEWKAGLPFFKLNEKIDAFYTRMKINENDYQKIDYVKYEAQLTLDKLIIKKASGMGTVKELDIAELYSVHYVESIVMLLHFGVVTTDDKNVRNSEKDQTNKSDKYSNEQFMENLFIKFNNQEELHRWDLALFINFKIVQSLKKDKLFNLSGSRSRSKGRKRSSESKNYDSNKKSKRSSDHIYEDDQELMKRLVQRRDLYLQTKKLVSERMIEKVNQKKSSPPLNIKKTKQIDYDEVDEYSQTQHFEIKDESLGNRSMFSNVMKGQDYLQKGGQKKQRANTSKFKDLTLESSLNLNNIQNVIIPTLNIGGNNTGDNRGLSFNPNQFELSLSKKLEEQRVNQANEKRKTSEMKNKKIKEIISKFTQEGYDLTKYSKDGFSPHEKRIFLSQDLMQFCWEQEGGKDKKQIKMRSIKQIQVQKIGQGIRKHIKKPKKQQHCIISYVKDNKLKVIELGANSTVMSQFVDELIMIRQHLKQKSESDQ